MRRPIANIALRTFIAYLLFGGLWILLSDQILNTIVSDTATLSELQTYKGWFYVVASGGLIYWLLHASIKKERQIEEELRKHSEKYRLLFETSLDPVLITDAETNRVLQANPAAREVFGMTQDELLQSSCDDILDHHDPRLPDALRIREATGRFHGELDFVRKNGEIFHGEVTTHLFPNESGQKRRAVIIRDISKRKQAEEALSESAERLRLATHASNVGFWDWDLTTNKVDFSKEYKSQLGYAEEEILDTLDSWRSLVHPDDLESSMAKVAAYLAKPVGPLENEFRMRHKDGSYRNIYARGELIRDVDGNPRYLLGCHVDLTSSKRAATALAERDNLLSVALSAARMGTWEFDLKTGSITWGSGYWELYGLREDQSPKSTEEFEQYVHPDDVRGLMDAFSQAVERNVPFEYEYRIIGPDQKERWHAVSGRALEDDAGEMARFIGIGMDISDRKAKELEIKNLLAELEFRVVERTAQLTAANEELEAFSYSVSHDLRGPLRSIHGFSQVIRDDYSGQFDESGIDALDRIQNAAKRMDDLINGLLHLARLTRAEMHKAKVDLSQVASDIERELRHFDGDRHVEFRIADGLICEADPSLIRAVLDNLLSNAWKFTNKQDTAVIEFGKHSESPTECVYFVKDNGVGFEMSHASKLFSPFERLHAHDKFPGSGIGLATVQRIISRHGGRIWAESEPGKGSTFYFSIPKAPKPVSVR